METHCFAVQATSVHEHSGFLANVRSHLPHTLRIPMYMEPIYANKLECVIVSSVCSVWYIAARGVVLYKCLFSVRGVARARVRLGVAINATLTFIYNIPCTLSQYVCSVNIHYPIYNVKLYAPATSKQARGMSAYSATFVQHRKREHTHCMCCMCPPPPPHPICTLPPPYVYAFAVYITPTKRCVHACAYARSSSAPDFIELKLN